MRRREAKRLEREHTIINYRHCKTEEERRERKLASRKRYYHSHKKLIQAGQRKTRGSDLRKGLVRSARKRAKAFNLPIDISYTDITIPDYCPILNIKLQKGSGKVQNESPSLDRVVPELGYVKGNVRVISYAANRLKSNMTKEVIEKLYNYVFNT